MLSRPVENAKTHGEGCVSRDAAVYARVERHLCMCFQHSLLCLVVDHGVGLFARVLYVCKKV